MRGGHGTCWCMYIKTAVEGALSEENPECVVDLGSVLPRTPVTQAHGEMAQPFPQG